jgi:putative nucleotidyltransferase with HDIG domain
MATAPASPTLRQTALAESSNGRVAAALAIVATVALFAVMFPYYPGAQRLDVDTVVSRDIVAPREVTYESVVLTESQRQQAADAIADVLVLDTEIRDRQLADLDRILNEIDVQRRDATSSASAKETAIQSIQGAALTQRSAATFVSATDARWATMRTEAQDALSRTLTGAVGPGEIEAARSRVVGFLSPLLSGDELFALAELLDTLVVPTLAISEERTETLRQDARANTPPVRVTYSEGQVIVPAGGVVDEAAAEAISQLDIRTGSVTLPLIAATAMASVLGGATLGAHLWVAKPSSLRGVRRLTLLVLTLLVPVAAAKFTLPVLLPDDERLFLALALPLAAGPIIATVLLDVSSGVIVSFVLAGIVGFIALAVPSTGIAGSESESLRLAMSAGASSLAALYIVARADRLQGYLAAGMAGAVASAIVALLVLLLDVDRQMRDVLWIGIACGIGGVLVATLSVGAFILLGRAFGIITRVELMELVQLNHPLLRRLQDEAPGTFQHSMLVGSLADRAADRIGADSLLVRVGAYYHDIGKLHSPGFFVENFGDGPNPHDNLDPLQSSRVIQSHVTTGIELARKHGIPEAVVAFIPQHHGSRLVAYFYREAAKLRPDIDPGLFRYGGPKPQTREAALVMLADSCEAAVRASNDRTPDRIRAIVQSIIRERVEEAQFDECDISLRDLRIVADSFVQALSAVYHPRVEYPEPTRRELAARGSGSVLMEDTPRRAELAPPSRPSQARTADDDRRVLSEDDS